MGDGVEILLAFYGDDFTGSTDALEFLSRAGARTVLFLEPPGEAELARFRPLDAVGIAGMTRTMAPEQMAHALAPALDVFKAMNPRHVHYKVCSTFDSSPVTGSIGKAIEVGAEIFGSEFIPLLVAAPNLGRYCAFGNLFARMGIGSAGEIFRLDRHPSMKNHPVTPADEGDLRLHLARQTSKEIGLFDILDIEKSFEDSVTLLKQHLMPGYEIILFDALYERQMGDVGRLMDYFAAGKQPLFSAGSSGIEKALGDWWKASGTLKERSNWKKIEKKEPLLVVSGSCSPVTAAQIDWAVSHGFGEIPVNPQILSAGEHGKFMEQHIKEAATFLKHDRSVVIHTCKGPDDPRIEETNALLHKEGHEADIARLYGQIMGKMAAAVLDEISLERIVIAGGDTSGHVARTLNIEAVEMIAPVVAGAPMCRAHAPGSPVDGIELNLKGGQVGDPAYFGAMLNGTFRDEKGRDR